MSDAVRRLLVLLVFGMVSGCFSYQASLGGTVGRYSRRLCDESHDSQAQCLRRIAAALDCEADKGELGDRALRRCAEQQR